MEARTSRRLIPQTHLGCGTECVCVGSKHQNFRPAKPGLTNQSVIDRDQTSEAITEIIPSPVEQATEPACDHAQAQGAPARMSWARLLKRVFDIDIDHCPNCGGSLKIITAIEDPPVIVRILTHLGLPTRAPPGAPAQRVDLFQTI